MRPGLEINGHEWDTAWNGLETVEMAAVADVDEEGRRAGRRTVEMLRGIYLSEMKGAKVEFPLKDRRLPLTGV